MTEKNLIETSHLRQIIPVRAISKHAHAGGI